MTRRRPIIIGNWKMNLGGRHGLSPARQLIDAVGAEDATSAELVILPPFTALPLLQELSEATPSALQYGAQDISTDDAGAYTGEISRSMLSDVGARYALAGHSERRSRHGEDGTAVNAKINAALRHGVVPIVCVGEELEVRRAGEHIAYTVAQVEEALAGISRDDVAALLIAYEPVWAIGTGEVATPDNAQEVCGAIRTRIGELYGADVAERVRILYGGSVKAATSAEIIAQPDIDGALVGGASLDPAELAAIWRAAA